MQRHRVAPVQHIVPLIGLASSAYHTPGQWLDSQSINQAEQVITIDGLNTSSIFVASIDELMNHYDVRGPYATELGRELARHMDRNIARVFIKAARSASPLTGRAGGTAIAVANLSTDADKMVAAFYTAAQTLDDKFIAEDGRFCVLKPAQYYLMVQNPKVLYKEYGGSADITNGKIKAVAGIDIVKSIHLPTTDESADATVLTKYRADYSKNVGFVANKWAVGTLTLADLSMDSDYEPRRQGTFMVAKQAVGHGVLRPDCAVELANV